MVEEISQFGKLSFSSYSAGEWTKRISVLLSLGGQVRVRVREFVRLCICEFLDLDEDLDLWDLKWTVDRDRHLLLACPLPNRVPRS
jgi:hypothetical protein